MSGPSVAAILDVPTSAATIVLDGIVRLAMRLTEDVPAEVYERRPARVLDLERLSALGYQLGFTDVPPDPAVEHVLASAGLNLRPAAEDAP